MHKWKRRKRTKEPVRWRAHFLPILAFVYRNRFAVTSQIQRRFPNAMPSDRTARRHLAELEATRCLGVADTRSTSPLFPKVYFVTGRGVRRIEESLRSRGKPGNCCRRDRRRPEAYSVDHVVHEILTTEFLLSVWNACEVREGLELLTVQRRSLERHRAFVIDGGHRRTRLKPDAMFVYRNEGGLMCCFLEMDNGTMSLKQMRAKFRRYGDWARSTRGTEYLLRLYVNHGAVDPQPTFRILVVARGWLKGSDERRLRTVLKLAEAMDTQVRQNIRATSVAALASLRNPCLPLSEGSWQRCQ